MARTTTASVPFLLLAACGGGPDGPVPVDFDRDGLTDHEEVELGSNPVAADSDGDGLSDPEEIDAGTDLAEADTDGDGYTDRDELHEGKDPLDPESVIYQGGWPYFFGKAAVPGGNTRATLTPGRRFGRFQFVDQFGDLVHLYDFYNAEKPVVIDVSALWCGPCQELARYVGGDPSDLSVYWPAGPDAVARGDVYWITVLGEGVERGEPPLEVDPAFWAEAFPAERIPVLMDPNYYLVDYVRLRAWPTLILLEPDLVVSERESPECAPYAGFYGHVLCELNLQFPD